MDGDMGGNSGLLDGKTALITGGSRGIGRAIAERFAEEGADVVVCARKESEDFVAFRLTLAERTGRAVVPMYFDLADAEQVKAAVREYTSSGRPLDILVNNAGVATGGLLQMSPLPAVRDVFDVNFFGPFLLTQGLSRYMLRGKSGSIINIASTAGQLGHAGTSTYGASKAALMLATKAWATELGRSGIRVNAIAPSVTRTEMMAQMDPKALERLVESSSLKRPAEPREIADVAVFLGSRLSSYVTGQVLRVDGGIV